MWIPGSVEEIEEAVARGELEETALFDAKQALPATSKQNSSVAVDVAAMSTAGGVLLYGVGEDADERLTVRSPLTLAGAPERIALIVQTSIAEVPHIEFRPYPLSDDPTKGYLLVIVPPSPRAPHQVTVGDDRRFYGRGAKGNRRLTEQEVALLYARRQQQEVDLGARLGEVVRTCVYEPPRADHGCVYAFVQPAVLDQGLWDAALDGAGGVSALEQRLASAASRPRTKIDFDPSLRQSFWHPVGADARRLSSQQEDPPRADFIEFLSDITFNIDGRAVLFAARAVERIQENANDVSGRKYVFERTIAGNLAALFASMDGLLSEANYFGSVDLGVAVTNLDGAVSVGRHENSQGLVMRSQQPTYNAATFTRVRRLGAASELQDAEALTLALLGRLFAATTGRDDYDPFVTDAPPT
jgi:hypothetical protein